MSHNDSILNILGIKDKNIKVISVDELEPKKKATIEHVTLVKATLSYPIIRCRNCGFRKTHIRLTDCAWDNNYQVAILKSLDRHYREHKIMTLHWKLFHKNAEDLHPEQVIFLC